MSAVLPVSQHAPVFQTPPPLRITFTKLSDLQHTFEVHRADGSSDRRVLDTRSFLVHDLIHYAVETEAGVHGGLYGSLARGHTHDVLSQPPRGHGEAELVEMVVGTFTPLALGRTCARDLLQVLHEWLTASSIEAPDWLDEAFAQRVQVTLARLLGQWRALPRGGSLELAFPG